MMTMMMIMMMTTTKTMTMMPDFVVAVFFLRRGNPTVRQKRLENALQSR